MVQGIRIVDGRRVVPHSWPWQVLLRFSLKSMCGGTLIAPQWVVTAAHCVKGRLPKMFTVRAGEHNRHIWEGTEQEITVNATFIHPQYNPYQFDNDIALLQLVKPVQLNKYVSPACVPPPYEKMPVGKECFMTGWGKTTYPGKMTNILRQTKMPIADHTMCRVKNFMSEGLIVSNHEICAGDGGSTRRIACHGDSGGPLVCNVNGTWHLHGVVSWGSHLCRSDQAYTVFTKVSQFHDWIWNIVFS